MHIDPSQWGVFALAVLPFLILFLTAIGYGGFKLYNKFLRSVPPKPRRRDLIPAHIQARLIEKAENKRIVRGLRRLWEATRGGWLPTMNPIDGFRLWAVKRFPGIDLDGLAT